MMGENVTNQDNASETQARKPHDALFKQVMTDLFSGLEIPITTEQEVSRKPRTIDVVITCTSEEIEKASRETPFDFLAENNIIAFKSVVDALTIWEYHKIRARAHFYIAENKLATSDTIICAVCSSEPRKVLYKSQAETAAAQLGVEVERMKLVVFILASLMTGAAVSACGMIGFVGLIIPHIGRMLFGVDHRILIPASTLLGAAFLILADTLARTILGAHEIPVGVVTAMCGGPFFIYLLRKRKKTFFA